MMLSIDAFPVYEDPLILNLFSFLSKTKLTNFSLSFCKVLELNEIN